MKSLGDMHGYAESRLDHLDHFNLDHPLTIHSSKRCHQHPFHLQVRQQVASVPSKAALTQVVHFLAITSMNPFFQYHVYIYIYIEHNDAKIWYTYMIPPIKLHRLPSLQQKQTYCTNVTIWPLEAAGMTERSIHHHAQPRTQTDTVAL